MAAGSASSARTPSSQASYDTPAIPGFPDARSFYQPLHGHEVVHLALILAELRKPTSEDGHRRRCIWLIGDSVLDNKHWVSRKEALPSVNGYPLPWMKPDVAYWINFELVQRGLAHEWFCLNAAVEESMLQSRVPDLLPQDEFARQWAEEGDAFICSAGSDDVLLRPAATTLFSFLAVTWAVPRSALEKVSGASPEEAAQMSLPVGLSHLIGLFQHGISQYVARVAAPSRPSAVLVCAPFFPHVTRQLSWAGLPLKLLGYDSDPLQLQAIIRALHQLAICRVAVPRVRVAPVAIYEVLDGSDGSDYVDRAELSGKGASKAGKHLVDKLLEAFGA